ncbi:MAG: hypothetical protein HN352_06910 [Bacteroidetes bacterium]|jgi:hypothetical protein|nr:hypothetical protein [Bacteroidota bacterium]MBT3749614.1 hypothetical protein [Bacteroidota bacterium]MBT4401688.1 hypothetical protein [Bacteroidota bacterium]MBT4411430.1 hypothetical protein [Bacteroidota bacterium]MBT5426177.1 hypothetical protein [Bacteroidota bacterium]
MIQRLILAIFIIIAPVNLFAQRSSGSSHQSYEVFVGMGSTHYFGEVGGPSDKYQGLFATLDNLGLDPTQSRLGWTLGGRYEFREEMALALAINPLWISGSDLNSKKEDRGYGFDVVLLEFAGNYEYYLAQRFTGLAPYATVGLAASVYRTREKLQPHWTKLQYTPAIIFGLGTRFPSRTDLTHSIELGFHYMWTDRLDGIKGSREVGDTFYFIKYCVNFELDKTYLFDYRGLVR